MTLNVEGNSGGTVQINEETAGTTVTKTVAAGTEVPIHAIAVSSFRFYEWSDGNESSDRTITVNSDTSLTASFVDLYE